MSLPEDIRLFYRYSNGFESNEDLFNVTPLHEVIERKDILSKGQYIFAEDFIYATTWELQIASPPEKHYFFLDTDEKVTNDLAVFLKAWERGRPWEHNVLYQLKIRTMQKLFLEDLRTVKLIIRMRDQTNMWSYALIRHLSIPP